MSVETVQYTMPVPKESKEIVDAVASIVQHFKQGGSLIEASSLLPAVMKAVDGWDKLAEEVKSEYSDESAGYTIHKLWGSLKD